MKANDVEKGRRRRKQWQRRTHDPPPSTMACAECHLAKVRCDKASPACSRCVRLKLECTPHISRQGQGKKRRKAASPKAMDGLDPSEDGTLLQQVTSSPQGEARHQRDHYGVRYLIRSWLSFAMRRRSFSLLSRAAKLAARLGIAMDEILCEFQGHRGMDFLYPILLIPAQDQRVLGEQRLAWTDLPEAILVATGTQQTDAKSISHARNRENRWIWAREMRQGQSRYLVSEAFDRDVASLDLIEKTWEENVLSVVDLFLADTQERAKHTKLFAHQISLHAIKGKTPEPSRMNKLKLKVGKQILVVDQIQCISIVDLDTAYLFVEYVRNTETTTNAETAPAMGTAEVNAAAAAEDTVTATNEAEAGTASDLADLNFIDFDDLVGGQDLDFVLGILEE